LADNHCALAMISKDGWAVFNDSAAAQWDKDKNWPWFLPPAPSAATCAMDSANKLDCNPGNAGQQQTCERKGCCYNPSKLAGVPSCYFPEDPTTRSDAYFFGYGHDYTAAMSDFYTISGRMPLLPRYLMGPQYSQWHAFNENDVRSLIEQGFASSGVPLDVMVLDMDWHTTFYGETVMCAGQKVDGWTGYTWETNLFPNPSNFLGSIKELYGLHVTNNMHPAAGVQCTEKRYPEMARAMGIAPSTNVSIPYAIGDKQYSSSFFETVLKPLGGPDGIDYWWIDWQQGETPIAPGVNPTIWVNYVFSSARSWFSPQDRPVIMARWGGVGSHRYSTIGFSGDVTTSWESLQFQPYFASTAANVGFYWSFDLGGFNGQPDPELYTRWVQWGTFCPILRTHCNGKKRGGGYTRDIWLYPFDNFVIMRESFLLRSKLVPYIYTGNYWAYEKGQALVRPLYYSFPENEEAYKTPNEYLFGSDMVVAPITTPSQEFNISSTTLWIPPGVWVEYYSGRRFTGPAQVQRSFLLHEVPVYVRAGAVIPTRSPGTRQFGSAQEVPESLELVVYPGLKAGAVRNSSYYDDDGITNAYTAGAYALTTVQVQATSSQTMELTIFPYEGKGFPQMPARRNYQFQFTSVWPASSVTVNGVDIPFRPYSTPSKDSWTYDGTSLSVRVNLVTKYDVGKKVEVKLQFPRAIDSDLLGFGFVRKVYVAQTVKDLLDNQWGFYYPDEYPHLLQVAGSALNATADNVFEILGGFNVLWAQANKEVMALAASPTQKQALMLLAMA
jgi:alpha-glucosidase